jgi:hypothetical protein
MVATSPFSACLTPQNIDDPRTKSSLRPPRPHTTTSASASGFFSPKSRHHLWDDIRELTTDVKDGVLGLKEVWMDNSPNKNSFMDDLSEFVEPHFGANNNAKRKSEKEGDNAKFFTFDKMERLLNYCVPLSVDPRSPKSRVRDSEDMNIVNGGSGEDIVEKTSSESKHLQDFTAEEDVESAQPQMMNADHLDSRSGETLPGFSEGLLEHTNRLREKLMDRSRHRSGALTTPARMLERRMDLQGRRSGSSSGSSEEEREVENAVVVPGGLWSIPTEERYGNSLSQSFADSRSMISSGSEERHKGSLKNAYYCGPNKMDDVLMMRSMSEDGGEESRGSFSSNGSDLTDLMHNSGGGTRSQEKVDSFEEKRKMDLVLDTELGLDERDDMDDVIHAAAMNAMNGLVSPRSLASEDKYMMDDDDEKDERLDDEQDPYADAHELSHYRRDAREPVSMYEGEAAESRDDNEAANRHFDSLMSDFELNLNRDDKRESKSAYGKSFQEKKQLVKRSRERKVSSKASPVNVEDDAASKTSHASNFSTATFLHQTTMGRKLNRSSPSTTGSLGGSVAGSRESVLDRARQVVTQVHRTMDSFGGEDIRSHERPAPNVNTVGRTEPLTRWSRMEPRPSTDGNLQESSSSAIATYKQRLMEQRSRRIQRDIEARERDGDIQINEPGDINPVSAKTNHARAEPQHGRGQRDVAAKKREGAIQISEPAKIKPMSAKMNHARIEPPHVQGPAKEPPANVPTIDMIMNETTQEETNLDICDSGANSFDSSVNWDALAYSMSGSMSMNEVQAPQPHDALPEIKQPDPVDNKTSSLMKMAQAQMQRSAESTGKSMPVVPAPSPQHQYPVMTRIDEIKKQHDEKMAQLRMKSAKGVHQTETYESDAPDDECGTTNKTMLNSPSQEENRPMSPNSIESNEYLSPKSKSMSHAVQKHIEAMKQQIEKEMVNNERHSKNTPKSTSSKQGSNIFNFDSPSRPSRKKSLKPSTEDLMLNNLQLEEEMEQIKALSPRSPDSWTSPRSPFSTRFGDHDVSSPRSPRVLSPRSPRSPRNKYTPSFMRSNERNLGLNIEIPVSPISTPRRTLRSTTSSSPKSSRLAMNPRSPTTLSPRSPTALNPRSPTEERVRTRVSDLMAEVKGFLAENDRARERIARDMSAMQAMHNY